MATLTLMEYEELLWDGPLTPEQVEVLSIDTHIDVKRSAEERAVYKLKPSSYVGAVHLGELSVVVRPKIAIDRVMFMISYAMDPKNWRRHLTSLQPSDGLLEAIALAFAFRTRQAIERGLLQGYRRKEDVLNTVRGRIRLEEQIRRRFDIPLPIDVAFDEYTEDIEKNRLLKTAIYRLGHTLIRSDSIRGKVRRLWPNFVNVDLGTYVRGALPPVSYTRLDEHYRPAVELARLVIENSILELYQGKVSGAAFFLDMNKVFELFLYVALKEALQLNGHQWRHEEPLTLDEDEAIYMKPDMSRWQGGTCTFVGDAKYKKLKPAGFENADIYQMFAYCTATNLRSGLLVYAAGEHDGPNDYKIKHAKKTIQVASLNLSGSPEDILREVSRIAGLVKGHTLMLAGR